MASVQRGQLSERLHNLNESVYAVEAAKLALILDMKSMTGTEAEVRLM